MKADVHLYRSAPDVTRYRNRRGLRHLGHRESGTLELRSAHPTPGHVDHVVDPRLEDLRLM